MKECELCKSPARMYCDSDQASLCWDCDAKVHCANFLVARHSRSLLCHACQSPTPWKASGSKLGPTVSICERCVDSCNARKDRTKVEGENKDEGSNSEDESDDDDEDDDDDDDGGDDDYDDEFSDDGNGDDDDEDGDGDNQVVPWSCTPPPPIASSSSSEESLSRFCSGGGVAGTGKALWLKRMRESVDIVSQVDLRCSSSEPNYNASLAEAMARTADEEATSFGFFRHSKDRKKSRTVELAEADSKPAALVSSFKRLDQNMLSSVEADTTMLGICKLSKDPGSASLISNESLLGPPN